MHKAPRKRSAHKETPTSECHLGSASFLVGISPGNRLYCFIFLTKPSRSSLRGENCTSVYLYQPNGELSEKRYQVNTIRSVFPNPALIGINYIVLFNSAVRLSAIPAYCLGSTTDGQTHRFAGHFVYPLKNWPNRSYFPVLWIFTRSGAQEILTTCILTSCSASSECLDASYLARPI